MRRIRFPVLIVILIGLAVIGLSYLFSPEAGLLIAVTLVCLGILWIDQTRRRNRRIKRLSTKLRQVLAGDYQIDLSEYEEGELSVLSADLYKLMIAFREQQASLIEDKTWLADSISDISHQLKTPITSMMMLTDLLKKDLEPQRRRQFLNQLSSQTDRLQWLVKNLLTLSKLDAQAIIYSPDFISYRDLIHQAIEPLLISLELKEQTLQVRGNLDTQILIDGNWLTEALTNIIKNASDHGPQNAPIVIEASDRPMSHTFEIINQGMISAKDLPHLFTRFYRGQQAATDSVGIGLAISREIVVQQGGNIEVESQAGLTTFRLRFPK